MKTTTLPLGNLVNRSPRRAYLLIPLVLACFALSPAARAVCQQGCLTNDNTILGDDALLSLTVGTENTAIGFHALYSNTAGGNNTATGKDALANNTIGSTNTANGSRALFSNTGGSGNTGIGYLALQFNTSGYLAAPTPPPVS